MVGTEKSNGYIRNNGNNGHYKEWKSKPLLSREKELELVERTKSGDLRAREELIASNIRIVEVLAARILSPEGCDYEDKVQQGLLGLIKAIDLYNPLEQTRFSTYACWWIKHYIHNPGSRFIKTPEYLRSLEIVAESVKKEYFPGCEAELGSEDLARIVSKEKGDSLDNLLKEFRRLGFYKVDLIDFSEQTERDFFSVTDKNSRYEWSYEWKQVQRAMKFLSKKERKVLKMRYSNPVFKFEEIGAKMGLTKQGAEKVKKRAIEKIRGMLCLEKG